MSILLYGTPMTPPSKNDVDKDKSREDDSREFPEDTDTVSAYVKDI